MTKAIMIFFSFCVIASVYAGEAVKTKQASCSVTRAGLMVRK